MTNNHDELIKKFPWLGHLREESNKIVDTLWQKEQHYAGSWQKRGGVGACMMLSRKWDRIEEITKNNGYDIFKVLQNNTGDVKDDVEDLVGYLLLCLAFNRLVSENSEGTAPQSSSFAEPKMSMGMENPFGFSPSLDSIPPGPFHTPNYPLQNEPKPKHRPLRPKNQEGDVGKGDN